jgi:hydroxymethylpyrimidine/phosphomethylpyrimidine kinase
MRAEQDQGAGRPRAAQRTGEAMTRRIPRILTIAGSDSGGGAGIQADIKTMTVLGAYGMSVITSVTAQNTVAVSGIYDLAPEAVERQLDAVLSDIGTDAAKTGMLSSAALIEVVAAALERYGVKNLVVDPVMVAKSGDALLREDARETLKARLLPLATIITPNIPEAEALTGMVIHDESGLRAAAEALRALGPEYVLIKGGHLRGGESTDYLYDGETVRAYSTRRIATGNTHGTGCTLSAAIATWLGFGCAVPEAVRLAKDYITGAIMRSDELEVGSGHGPLHHGWRLQPPEEGVFHRGG